MTGDETRARSARIDACPILGPIARETRRRAAIERAEWEAKAPERDAAFRAWAETFDAKYRPGGSKHRPAEGAKP